MHADKNKLQLYVRLLHPHQTKLLKSQVGRERVKKCGSNARNKNAKLQLKLKSLDCLISGG